MASGGRRPGAGRPKKAAAQKILEGNPGRREIEVVTFNAEGVETVPYVGGPIVHSKGMSL